MVPSNFYTTARYGPLSLRGGDVAGMEGKERAPRIRATGHGDQERCSHFESIVRGGAWPHAPEHLWLVALDPASNSRDEAMQDQRVSQVESGAIMTRPSIHST